MDEVRKYYNGHLHEEDKRLKYHAFELPVTMHFLKQHLSRGAKIFDTACGTGHYAKALIKEGYYVGLNDLSEKNIELSKQRLDGNSKILFYERSDVLETNAWSKYEWDAIFILGPLYHMLSKEKRLRLLSLANKYLKPGGYLFASFMSRIGALVYGLKNNPEGILYRDGVRKLWKTGFDDSFIGSTESFVNAYFSSPDEIPPLFERAGLKILHLAGVEGIFGERFELFHGLNEELQKAWMDFIIDHCQEGEMICNSKHLLAVARKQPG